MVFVDSISHVNEFRPEATNWLLGVVQERIVTTINISIREVAIAPSANSPFEFFPSIGFINAAQIIKAKTPVFVNFKTGDTIKIINASTNNRATATITEKVSDYVIRTGETFVNAFSTSAEIISDDTVDGFNFRYGLIENDEAFNTLSKIDGSDQLFYANSISAADLVTVTNMLLGGSKAWQNGSCTIVGLGVDTYNQKFRIVHTCDILPNYLEEELDNFKNKIISSIFKGTKCLRYVADFEGLYDISDPNRKHSGQYDLAKGNTGWHGENFNNKPTKYSVDTVTYTKPDTSIVESVLYTTQETTVELKIKSTVDAFSNNNTKFLLCFELLPSKEEYSEETRNIKENFLFDRKLQTVGSAAANGDNYGTDQQVLKDVTATFVDAKNITINFKVKFSDKGLILISGLSSADYALSVVIQNHTLTSVLSDKTNVLADVGIITRDLTDDGLISFDSEMIEHDDADLSGTIDPETFPGDELIMRNIIRFDTEGRDKNKISFDKAIVKIIAENSTKAESFELEKFIYDFTNDVKVNGVTQVDVTQEREFIMASTDVRKLIKIKRRSDIDEVGVLPPTNLATNGNFDLSLTGWTVAGPMRWETNPSFGGTARCYQTTGPSASITQTIVTTPGTEYTVEIEVKATLFSVPALQGLYILFDGVYSPLIKTVGVHKLTRVASGASAVLSIVRGYYGGQYNIDNIKVYEAAEVTSAETNKFFYEISYPFLMRWEYWENLLGVNNFFFNTSSPQNGQNHLWQHYQSSPWSVKAICQLIVNNDGFEQTYEKKLSLPTNNYSSNSLWTTKTLKSYDLDSSELLSGSDRLFYNFENVRLEAIFEKSVSIVAGDITVVIWAEAKEAGGITGRTRISSKYVVDSGSWFKSVDTSNKVKLTIVGNNVKAEALLDYTKLPAYDSLRVYARIYENNYTGEGLLLESGDFLLQESGDFILLES